MKHNLERVIGIDIGGANIKLASLDGKAISQPFPMWQDSKNLHLELSKLLKQMGNFTAIACTMTGELADCFESKKEGVHHIVEALMQAITQAIPNDPLTKIYLVDGTFADPIQTKKCFAKAAASNWHATASLVASRFPNSCGMLIDIGSTTSDIIPFESEKVATPSQTDLDRLIRKELVYTGVGRTPVFAVTKSVELSTTLSGKGSSEKTVAVPLAAELFATTLDVYTILKKIPPDSQNCNTANGKPQSMRQSQNRLARSVCCDLEELSEPQVHRIAECIAHQQLVEINKAITAVQARQDNIDVVVIAGEGEFLLREIFSKADLELASDFEIVSFSDLFGDQTSDVAAAFAVADLLQSKLTTR